MLDKQVYMYTYINTERKKKVKKRQSRLGKENMDVVSRTRKLSRGSITAVTKNRVNINNYKQQEFQPT